MRPTRHAASRAAALIFCTASAVLAATPAAAQVQVTLRPLTPPEAFYVADLLPGSAGVRPDLIGITLLSPEGVGRTISLELTVARESPSPAQIFRGTTDPFVLDQAVRHLTSRDLASRGRDVSITDVTVNEDAITGPGGRSGRLLPGTYLFRVIVRGAEGQEVDGDELRLTFTSPTRVELLSPGAPADMPPPVVLSPTPRFLWSADGESPNTRFRVRVVKVDGAGSAVEALQSGFPAWDALIAGTSAFYPASVQALRLEPGATYAWQVTRELSTSGGNDLVESPIYWFRVGGAGTPGAPTGALGLRFAALLRALGLSELDGFTPVGATLEDGRVVPLETLEALLAAVEAGEISVLSVRVR
ncbi:MAG TPA: hypothetical protein VEX86_21735 [Longimicrobium sp.]|nr:hypothetical protein [Longimicrobium sp.]